MRCVFLANATDFDPQARRSKPTQFADAARDGPGVAFSFVDDGCKFVDDRCVHVDGRWEHLDNQLDSEESCLNLRELIASGLRTTSQTKRSVGVNCQADVSARSDHSSRRPGHSHGAWYTIDLRCTKTLAGQHPQQDGETGKDGDEIGGSQGTRLRRQVFGKQTPGGPERNQKKHTLTKE